MLLLALFAALSALTLAQSPYQYGCYTEGSNNIRALLSNSITYEPVECYVEPPVGRALDSAMTGSDVTTVEVCANWCLNGGCKWFGLEYKRECWCGTGVNPNATVASVATECGMACSGDAGEICGGSGRVSDWKWV